MAANEFLIIVHYFLFYKLCIDDDDERRNGGMEEWRNGGTEEWQRPNTPIHGLKRKQVHFVSLQLYSSKLVKDRETHVNRKIIDCRQQQTKAARPSASPLSTVARLQPRSLSCVH